MKKLLSFAILATILVACGKNETSSGGFNNNILSTTGVFNGVGSGPITTLTGAQAQTKRSEIQAQMSALSATAGITVGKNLYFTEGSGFTNGYAATLSRRYNITAVDGSTIDYDYQKPKTFCISFNGSTCVETLSSESFDESVKQDQIDQAFNDQGRTLNAVETFTTFFGGQNLTCHTIKYLSNYSGRYSYTVCPNLPALANPVSIKEEVSGGVIRILTSIE